MQKLRLNYCKTIFLKFQLFEMFRLVKSLVINAGLSVTITDFSCSTIVINRLNIGFAVS